MFLTDLHDDALEKQVNKLQRHPNLRYASADVRSSTAVDDVVAACVKTFGALDCLINSAGIFPEQSVQGMTDAQWKLVHEINLDGTFYACRAAAPLMRDGGSIVNLTSIAAHRGSVNHAHYASTKAAVLGFSRSLAQELAPRIRVNCVSPGPVDTAMVSQLWDAAANKILAATPMRRICRPEEVARTIAFLASDWASFITAETIHVNGGHYIYG